MSLNIISRYDFLHSELDWNAQVWNIHYDTWLSNATFDDKKLFAEVFSAYVSIPRQRKKTETQPMYWVERPWKGW